MASQGPFTPGAFADDAGIGTIAWANPSNAGASDDSRAVATLDIGETSHYLKATMGGSPFSIPDGATVDGIVVEIEKSESSGVSNITDVRVRVVKGGTIGATDRSSGAEWPTTDAYTTYGSPSDLWGETWTVADINGSTFGAVIAAVAGTLGDARVDHMRITVYYTAAGSSDIPYQPWQQRGPILAQ